MERNWLIHDCIWSVEGGTVQYLVALGQYGTVLVGTWWYCVSIGWYWLIYDGNESEKGSTG